MMIHLPVVAFFLVAAVSASPSSVMSQGQSARANTNQMKTPCCPPKQFQAALVDLNSQTALEYATLYAFDATKKVEGSLTVRTNGGNPVYQTFTDYNTMTQYSVSLYGDPSTHKCEISKAPHNYYDECFTSSTAKDVTDLTYLGNSTFGAIAGGLTYEGWSMKLEGALDIMIALADEGCTPILEKVKGMQNGKMIDSLILFNDFSDKITTMELITKPPACVSKTSAVVG